MSKTAALIVALIAAFVVMGAGAGFADTPEITIEVDQKAVTLSDTLTVTAKVTGGGLRTIGSPELPDSPYFQVVGRSSSHNFTMLNSQVSVEKATVFSLMPLRTGRTRIGPATVRWRNKTYKSNTVEIQIVDAGTVAPPGAPAPSDKIDSSEPIFLKTQIEEKSSYLGAQLTVSLYLYSRVELTGLSFSRIPDFKDFWAEELLVPQRPSFQEVEVNGIPYQAALIRRYALFPLKAGEATIDSFAMNAQVISSNQNRRKRSGWPFDDDPFSMFGRRKQVELESFPVNIDVAPLPDEGRPDSFQNVVGRFKMRVQMDRAEVPAGEPITLEMIVTGQGNFKTLVAPKARAPESFNTYSETSEQELQTTAQMVGGEKRFSMILVPREPGDYSIGPITLDYFDPTKRLYKQLTAGPLQVSVTGKSTASGQVQAPITQREVTRSGQDIRYIRADANRLADIRPPYYLSPAFLLFLACWPCVAMAIFLAKRYRKQALADVEKQRYRKAGRVSRTRLKKARSLIGGKGDDFYLELTVAILGFVADKTGATPSGIVVPTLMADLARAGASETLLSSMRELFAEADAVRYGGKSTDAAAHKAALKNAQAVLGELDAKKLVQKIGKR